MMLLRARTLAMGYSGVRPVVVDAIARAAQRRHHAVGARARLARRQRRPRPARPLRAGADRRGRGRSATARASPRRAGRGRHRAADAAGQGGPGAHQRHRRDARHARARPRRPRRAAAHGRRRRGDARRGAARHRPRLRRRPQALRPHPGQTASAREPARGCSPARPIVASHRNGDARVQDAYSLRCAPQVHGAARDTARPRRARSPTSSCARRSTTRWCCPTGGSSRAATSTARRSASPATSSPSPSAEVGAIAERRTDRLLDRTRSHGLPPFLADGRRRQLGADDRPVHAGGDGRREPPPRRAGQRRLDADRARCRRTTCRWAGRAARKLRTSVANLARILAVELVCAARGLDLRRAARSRRRPPAAALAALRDAASAAPAPTAGWRPSWPPPSSSSRRRRAAVDAVAGRDRRRCA